MLNQSSEITKSSRVEIKLGKNQSLGQVSVAFNNSFVLSIRVEKGLAFSRKILHIDRHGNILSDTIVNSATSQMKMLKDDQVIFQTRESRGVSVLNLKTKKVKTIYKFQVWLNMLKIETFSQTQLIGLVLHNCDRLLISFIKYDSFKEVAVWNFKKEDEIFDQIRRWNSCKVDEHSGIAWFRNEHCRYSEKISFYLLSLDQEYQPTLTQIITQNTLGSVFPRLVESHDWRKQTEKITVQYIKRGYPSSFLLSTNSYKVTESGILQIVCSEDREKNHKYVINRFDESWTHQSTSRHLISSQYLILQVKQGGQYVVSLFDKQTRSITMKSSHKNNPSLCPTGWNDRVLTWFQQDHESPRVLLGHIFVFSHKDFALQALLHFNQDFDDDLLQDALTLHSLVN